MLLLTRAASRLRPDRKNLRTDVRAGIIQTLVTVPDSIAASVLAGINPVHGLYGLLLATPVAALFTSSVFMNVNITSSMALAVNDSIGHVSPAQQFQAVIVLTILVGIFQLTMGLLRLGTLVRFVSNSVMTGFLTGLAVNIMLGQLSGLTGYSSSAGTRVAAALDTILHFKQFDVATTIVGIVTMVLIVGLAYSRLNKVSVLLTLAIATIMVPMMGLHSVVLVGNQYEIPTSLPSLTLPNLSYVPELIPAAIAVGIVGLVQGAGISRTYKNPDGKYPNVSGDFTGQGIANIASGLFQGMPAGGSLSGTAVLVSSGAKSRYGNLFAGLFIFLTILFLTPVVERLPMAALSGMLIVVGYRIIKPKEIRTIFRTGAVPATAMVVTFISTLILSLVYAIFLGVGLSILLMMVQKSSQVKVMEWKFVKSGVLKEGPPPAELPSHEITVLQLFGDLNFASASIIEEQLPNAENAKRPVVMLGLRGREDLGSTFLGVLVRYNRTIKANGGRLMLIGVGKRVEEQLTRTGVAEQIGRDNIFPAEPELVAALDKALTVAKTWLDKVKED